MMKRIVFAAALAIAAGIPLFAEDDDIDAQMKKVMENPNKPAASNAAPAPADGASIDLSEMLPLWSASVSSAVKIAASARTA